jgi:hypothetical protein
MKKPPKALVANARAKHSQREQSLAEAGFAALELIRDRQRTIGANFLDIGAALATLKRAEVIEAMGSGSWEALCVKLRMSVAHADNLIAVATRLRRTLAQELGIDRASAVLALVDATPEDDTAEEVLDSTRTLPSGARLVVRSATTEALWAASRELRQAAAEKAGAKRRGGKTTTAAERASFRALEKRVAKVEGVKVALVARGTKQGAKVRAEFPLAMAEAFAALLGGGKK